ncbi:MAG: ribonuclease HII [Clostridia bacterium]|nr:ribonuclease HII [Clostridia bacterium]
MPRESKKEKLARLTVMERELWDAGATVAGIDEVGRGPLAGPVVACCIVIPKDGLIPGVDDSKKLSEKRREELYDRLIDAASYVRLARLEACDIDRINILEATKLCMEQAASQAQGAVFLIDAVKGLKLPGEQRPIIHGDAISYMIAAASIVAKVERDRWMIQLDRQYPMYGFARNKGYGTGEHIKALREYGPCPQHRRSFIKKIC